MPVVKACSTLFGVESHRQLQASCFLAGSATRLAAGFLAPGAFLTRPESRNPESQSRNPGIRVSNISFPFLASLRQVISTWFRLLAYACLESRERRELTVITESTTHDVYFGGTYHLKMHQQKKERGNKKQEGIFYICST